MASFLDILKFLLWAEIVERYALLVLITYLTDVRGLGLTHAAALINIWVGITKALPLAFLFLIYNYTGSYWMLLIATTASGIGMGLLSISTPSFFYSRIAGSCSEYNPKCISETQKSLFYAALLLIMIGQSARKATKETLVFKGNASEQEQKKREVASGAKIVTLIAGFVLPMVKPWSIRFGIPAVCSLVVARLLMSKSWSHKVYIDKPKRCPPVRTVLRVSMASTSRMFRDLPKPTTGLMHEIENGSTKLLRSSTTLRRLEEGEILLPTHKNKHDKWIVHGHREVEDTKALALMLVVCLMFIFLGLVSSVGNTYFVEQAKRLNPRYIFGEEFTVSFFVMIHDSVKGKRLNLDIKKYKTPLNQSHGVLISSVYGFICCLISALVERRRLNVITRNDLANKPDDIIPMTIFWLLPQFYALGMFDGIFQQTFCKFFSEEIPSSMRNLGTLMSQGLIGLGMVTSVLAVYVIGMISEIGGKPNWFQHNTENSRLDNFYWVLTTLCVIVFRLWAQLCNYMDGESWRKIETLTTICIGIVFLSFLSFFP